MITKIIRRIRYPHKYSSPVYVKYLSEEGMEIGNNSFFYNPEESPIDETSLKFIHMGCNCRITSGVRILGHDYSYAVVRPTHHAMLRKTGHTRIGNNVFIGYNSIILMNTTIGDNVIIGAGSVVSGIVPPNVIVAGNPAKVISTLDEYYEKLQKNFKLYAKTWYEMKKESLNREPTEEEMGWFVVLWESSKKKFILEKLRVDGDSKEDVLKDCLSYPSEYFSFEDFKNSINSQVLHEAVDGNEQT